MGGRRNTGIWLILVLTCAAAVLLALVAARWTPLRQFDDAATRETHASVLRHPALTGPLRATAYVFHPWVFRVVVLALAWWTARTGERRVAAWAVATMVVAAVVEWSLKALVGRPRPLLPDPIAHAAGASFPSGHALTAVVGCAVIVLVLRPAARAAARVAAVVVSLVAGASRVLLGVHYVSDVVAGWILGIAIVLAMVAAARPSVE